MKYLPILTLCILFLSSCAQEDNKQDQAKLTISEAPSVASSEVTPDEEIDKKEFSIRAKFVGFSLGDAEHYSFEKESGEAVSFDGCLIDNFDFAQGLEEAEANEENQGWGSNSELQGKCFGCRIRVVS